jgi:DNA modification methylase
LIGARKEGFNFIGIEKDAKYVEIAKQRIKPFMEQKSIVDFHGNQ